MFFLSEPKRALEYCVESARTTHGAKACLDASRYFGGLLLGAMLGESKKNLLSARYSPPGCPMDWNVLSPEVAAVAAGSFAESKPPEICGSGYVVESLEAALWAFAKSASFDEGALLAVNLGDDADTTGAIYGQIAGAHYGVESIPESWRAKLAMRDRITELAEGCFEGARIPYSEVCPNSL